MGKSTFDDALFAETERWEMVALTDTLHAYLHLYILDAAE